MHKRAPEWWSQFRAMLLRVAWQECQLCEGGFTHIEKGCGRLYISRRSSVSVCPNCADLAEIMNSARRMAWERRGEGGWDEE